MKPNNAWLFSFPFLAALLVLTGCRLLPVTDMSPPLTHKNYYFEISATGFSDTALAIQTFDMFFNLYRKKVDSR
jgi:hypothetical protein